MSCIATGVFLPMKNSIFEKSFEDIFTPYRLSYESTRLRPKPNDIEAVRQESDIDRGFEYLGISFVGSSMRMDGTRLTKKIEKLKKETEKLSIEESVTKLNQKIVGFKNYYEKIIDDYSQMQRLQNALDEIIIQKIIQAKTSKKVNNKTELRAILIDLKSYDEVNHKRWIEELISQAYQELALQTPLITAQKRVASEKSSYLQQQIKSSEIVVSEVGAFLGFSQGKIKVKVKGKVVLEAPINRIKRILLLNKQSSLSSYLIKDLSTNTSF